MILDAERLQRYCASNLSYGHEVKISGISDPRSGVESDVYFFRLEHGPASTRATEDLALRLYTRVDAYRKSWHEFTVMRQLREAGYPVPHVLVVERDNSPFARPFLIMERVIGQEMWQLLNGASRESQRQVLTRLADLLVQLHSLDSRRFAEDSGKRDADSFAELDRWLETFRELLTRFPIAGLEPVFEWLALRRKEVPRSRPAVVHSDFHPGNVLVRNDGTAVVLDWAGLEVSDPRFDLAHTLLLLGCIGANSEWRDTVLAAYEELTAARVEGLAYFEVAACFKWFVALTVSMRYGCDKLGLGPDAATRLNAPGPILKKAHDLLHHRSGIAVPEIARILP